MVTFRNKLKIIRAGWGGASSASLHSVIGISKWEEPEEKRLKVNKNSVSRSHFYRDRMLGGHLRVPLKEVDNPYLMPNNKFNLWKKSFNVAFIVYQFYFITAYDCKFFLLYFRKCIRLSVCFRHLRSGSRCDGQRYDVVASARPAARSAEHLCCRRYVGQKLYAPCSHKTVFCNFAPSLWFYISRLRRALSI